MSQPPPQSPPAPPPSVPDDCGPAAPSAQPATEIGGAKRSNEPTRYGDWEIGGKCVDF